MTHQDVLLLVNSISDLTHFVFWIGLIIIGLLMFIAISLTHIELWIKVRK